ncbi:hypothetical protein O6H91_24G003300 [Diphasiastrum complanatum]|uniref:Uncharacterized protein n=1 Tax=Diphasiastrum complanatum TaxID=34168 RepID=A0ACC2A747_DIPCM|nr:hypothetical protein O6H91_24G003300 [Diphasiastrum complanatum]
MADDQASQEASLLPPNPSAPSASLPNPPFLSFLPFPPLHPQIPSPFWQIPLPSDPASHPHLSALRDLHFPMDNLQSHAQTQHGSAPFVAMPSGDGQRGMMAPRTASPAGTVQFPARQFVLPSSVAQSGGGYSAIRSQASVSGLQLFAESPESSLLDPQTSPNSRQRLTSELPTFNLRPRPTQGLPAAQPEAPFAPRQQQTAHQQVYPPPLAAHQDVVADRQLFFRTLTQFHAFFGTELVIPKIDGGELDLHLLYCQVTASGGLEQVIKLKKWDHIIMKFGLPTQVSGQPFFLRKHYSSLLHHYEQVYFFRREGLLVPTPVPLPSPNPISVSRFNDQPTLAFGENMEPAKKRRRKTFDPAEMLGADAGKLVGRAVTGAIDGKFEHGYLVTVHVGTENLRGILYHVPKVNNTQQIASLPGPTNDIVVQPSSSDLQVGLPRRKRRGRRMSKRDPNAPRLNRSGYNFYFAEQRSRLKHLGSENAEITRIIGDSWQRLTEQERMRDKERYRMEKQVYSERINMQPQRKQGEGFVKDFSESLHDSGHAPEELDEAEQDSGDFNDSRHDYHVSLDADIDGGEMNLQNQIYAEYVSGGHLGYSQEQLYYTNTNHGQEPLGYGSERTVPLHEDKDYAADRTDDPPKRSQYISEKALSSQPGVQYVLEDADLTQEGRRTEEQTNHIEETQQYPDNEQNQFAPLPHFNHFQAEQVRHAQGYQDLSNDHTSEREQCVSTQQKDTDEQQYFSSKQTAESQEHDDMYSRGTYD